MPETVTKYKVFLSSPSDLSEERSSIDEVINELNLTFGKPNNLVLELMKWETHSAPGISDIHPQELINEDIDDEYDLFIGLMWLRFGTPTKKAGSGTEEEYKRAFDRFNKNSDSLQILFYFKNTTPLNLQDIVPSELEKVNNFKTKLGQENVLYWHYGSIGDLQSFLRIHIPKRLAKLISKQMTQTTHELVKADSQFSENEDLGLLDYLDIVESKFDASTNAALNITEATEWIGEKIIEKADEIKRANQSSYQKNTRQIRILLKQTAQVMNEYAARISVEIPIFFENYEEGIRAMSSIINIADDFFDQENIQELKESKESIIKLNAGIAGGLSGMNEFNEAVNNLPRIDKEINKAKRNISDKLRALINDLNSSSQLAVELVSEISEKIDRIEITFANKQ